MTVAILTQRVFRLFISSTFSDFVAEREALQKEVFPKLEDYCAKRGARFQAVDLRWGITEEAQREHETMRICLEEVRRCQQLSQRPNFAVLLGDRYGWEPVPARIPQDHWQRLMKAASQVDRELIKTSYRLDENAVPPMYCLRERDPEPVFATRLEADLLQALRRAARGFRGSNRLPYFTSATHQEIVLGALSRHDEQGWALNPEKHVHVYVRHMQGLPNDERVKDFIDWDSNTGQPIHAARQRIRDLQLQLRRQLGGHVHDFHTTWSDHGDDDAENEAYLKRFCDAFLSHQTALIDAGLEILGLDDEQHQREKAHRDFGEERARVFAGRKALLARIARYTSQANKKGTDAAPLILIGGGGSGKSAVLARAAQESLHAALNSGAVVMQRYIGGVPGSESLMMLLTTLSADIASCYDKPQSQLPETAKALADTFYGALTNASADRPLFLYLDALDQLDAADGAWMLEWLPGRLPKNVRVVVSVRAGTTVEQAARTRYPRSLIEVSAMGLADGRAMLQAWLADKRAAWFNAGIAPSTGRILTPVQQKAVLSAFQVNGSALWLKLAYDESATWASWDIPRQLPTTVQGLIEDLIENRLVGGENHPQRFTERALAFLAAGRFGLSESELDRALANDPFVRAEFQANEKTQRKWEDYDHLPPILWSRLFFDLQPYLKQIRMDGTLLYSFFHREFQEAMERIFLFEPEQQRSIHGHLSNILEARAPHRDDLFQRTEAASKTLDSAALRRIMEQPWQLARAGRYSELTELLVDLGFCLAKCATNRVADLISDYALVPKGHSESTVFSEFQRFMISRASLLYRGNLTWPANRILLQLASETPDESHVGRAAERWRSGSWDTRPWLRSHHRQPSVLPSMVLEGHTGDFSSFISLELEDGMLLSRHVDYRLWNLETGQFKTIHPISTQVLVIATQAVSHSEHPQRGVGGEVLFWSAQPETIRMRHCDVEGMSMCNALELQDGRIIWLRDAKTLQAGAPARSTATCALVGHSDVVTGFLELADGRILSWSADATLRVWYLPAVGLSLEVYPSITLTLHKAPILGAVQLPSGSIVSWDFAGGFVWTDLGEPLTSRFLVGMDYATPPDPKSQLEVYRNTFDTDSLWQRGTLGSDHASAGAMWIDGPDNRRLLTWKPGSIHWFDANGVTQGGQSFDVDESKTLSGLIHLPGFGTARVFNGSERIILQAYASETEVSFEEPEARSISGILRLTDHRFCTWSGRKRGDSTLRIWTAIDGDWHKGAKLDRRLEGHSKWIHTVTVLRGSRVVSCGEDDAVRVWNLQDQEEGLPQALEANKARYVGHGKWRVHLFGYSKGYSLRPLILVDALSAEVREITQITHGKWNAPEVVADRDMAIVNGELVIEGDGSLVPFETPSAKDVEEGVDRSQSRLQVINSHLIISLRSLSQGTELTAWVRTFMDDRYWEASRHFFNMPNLQPLVRLGDEVFAAWGQVDYFEIWRVSLEDFGEQEVFQCVARIDLPAPPDGVVFLGNDQLLVWSKSGYLLRVQARTGKILKRLDIPQLAGVHAVDGMPVLAWSQDRQIWRIDSRSWKANALGSSPDADITGLVTLTAEQFLSLSTDGHLRRWRLQGSTAPTNDVLFPGRYMSRAQFFWSLDTNEDVGLPAGNPLRDQQGNVLMMTTFAPAAFALLLYTQSGNALHLMVIDHDHVKLFDAASPGQAMCQWHFPRSSYRDDNLELGLSASGELVVMAGTAVVQLSLMRGSTKQRLDFLSISERVPM